MAISSARRSGWYQGSTSTQVPRPRPGQAAATCDMKRSGLAGLRNRVNGTIAIARDAITWAIRFGGSPGRGHVVVLGEVAAGCASGAFFRDRGPARPVGCGATPVGGAAGGGPRE